MRSYINRYSSGQTSFEQLLVEEMLQPEMQEEWRRYSDSVKSPVARDKKRRALAKRVYDRVRKNLAAVGPTPRLQRDSVPWYQGLFPDT